MTSLRGALTFLLLFVPGGLGAAAPEPFRIRILDAESGRGVPLVELRTVHQFRFLTDSAGLVAVREPELFGERVFFHVSSHGYEFPPDGFGIRGAALEVRPGGEATLKIRRVNLAVRLYRITGAGIYADSRILGEPVPISEPLLNARVTGSDSAMTAIYRGRLYWFWGDTNQLKYPLGNFHATGATSRLPGDGGLDPARGIDLEYFVGSDGFARPMAKFPGEGPTWLIGVVTVRDEDGRERLLTGYEKVRGLEAYERGLAEFDDERQEFRRLEHFSLRLPLYPYGHPFLHTVDGREYLYFADPYPFVRVRATYAALRDLGTYEGFTCLRPGDRADSGTVERDAVGKVVWGWKRDTAPITWELQERLLKGKQLTADEAWLQLTDADRNTPVIAHRGSVSWNDYRRRWIMVTTELKGSSVLGEVWYSEAGTPEGPWRKAKKIVTHDRYSFYNPLQHPYFAQDGGRVIYFEGTYTHAFSGNPDPTPRYDYNQIMYRLDLADSRLAEVFQDERSPNE